MQIIIKKNLERAKNITFIAITKEKINKDI